MAKRYQNREWRNSMRIRLDYNNMMSEFVGEKEGFTLKMINSERSNALRALERIKSSRGKGWLGWMDLPFNQADIVKDINETAKKIRKTAKN
ncbi:MAG: glucose-6-phosphate isomerase, partial [Clostridia bacterium]|nr:glucose-6-phosphate isomerase [Clostridia bacterium]